MKVIRYDYGQEQDGKLVVKTTFDEGEPTYHLEWADDNGQAQQQIIEKPETFNPTCAYVPNAADLPDGDPIKILTMTSAPKRTVGDLYGQIEIDITPEMREHMGILGKLLPPTLSELADNLGKATAPMVWPTWFMEAMAKRQRAEDERRLFQLGDGQTSIVSNPFTELINNLGVIADKFVKDVDEIINRAKDDSPPDDPANLARQRSRDDLKRKRKEFRKNKGKL